MLKDPALKQAVTDALQGVNLSRDRGTVALIIDLKRLPVDVAFEVFLRQRPDHHRQWRIGSFALRATSEASGPLAFLKVPDRLEHSAIDIIFRPSLAVALRDMHVTNIWGDEIVVENVEVRDTP